MTTSPYYEALCWGGPLEGQLIANKERYLRAVFTLPGRSRYRANPIAPINYSEVTYTWERVGVNFDGGVGWIGAWIISSPIEHREFHQARILGGINLILWWARGGA